MDEQSQVNVI